MTDNGTVPLKANWRSLALRCAFAPALLIVVAIAQIVLVEVRGLSVWKGGGFGMFAVSTHRMTTIDGETLDGTIVKIAHRPDGYEHLGWMNDSAEFRRLAEDLLALEYVDALDQSDDFLANIAVDDPAAAAKLAEMLAKNQERRADAKRSVWLRPSPDDALPAGVITHHLRRVTVRRWQVQFDPATDRLRLVADGDSIVALAEPAPGSIVASDASLATAQSDVGD